jgi:hypothetical protein
LSNYKLDIAKSTNKNPSEQTKFKQKQEIVNLSFVQIEGKYYCCSKAEYKSLQYQFEDKPKAKWAINISQQSYAQASKTNQ